MIFGKEKEYTRTAISNSVLVLFFLVSLVPFNFLPFKIGGIPFHFLFLGSTVSVLILCTFSVEKLNTTLNKWLLIILSGFFLSLINSIDRTNTLRTICSFILRGLGIAFISQYVFKGKIKSIVPVILIATSLVCLVGLIEFFFQWNPYFKWTNLPTYFSIGYPIRIRSGMAATLGHPLALSSYLILFLPLSLWFIQTDRFFLRSIPFLLIASTIFFSFSRSSWFLALIIVLFYLFLEVKDNSRHRWKIIAFLLIFIVSSLIFVKSNNSFPERTDLKNLKTSIFSSHRSASYKTTYNILKDYPFFGVGFGNYPLVHEIYRAEGTIPYLKTPDNIYLRFLCETGLVGTAIFITFLSYWFYKLWKNRENTLILAFLIGLFFFMLNQIVADLFYWLAPQFSFWLLLGIVVSEFNINSFVPIPNNRIKYNHIIGDKYFRKQTVYKQIINLIENNSLILDIGCATGYLGNYLIKNKNCSVYGIEIEEEPATLAKNCYKDVYLADIEDASIFSTISLKFDYIVLGDVIEHLVKPERVLLNIHKLMKTGSSLIVSIPNIASWRIRFGLLFGHFNYTETGILDKTHLRFFTLNSSIKMFQECGYKITYFCGAGTVMPGVMRNLFPSLFASQFVFELKSVNK